MKPRSRRCPEPALTARLASRRRLCHVPRGRHLSESANRKTYIAPSSRLLLKFGSAEVTRPCVTAWPRFYLSSRIALRQILVNFAMSTYYSEKCAESKAQTYNVTVGIIVRNLMPHPICHDKKSASLSCEYRRSEIFLAITHRVSSIRYYILDYKLDDLRYANDFDWTNVIIAKR